MEKTLALMLAGGRVDELSVLTLYRPKSALPFGGLYRVIDFPLSNLMNSGIERIGILSQYRSDSLINHIGSGAGWDMIGSQRGITMLPPMKGTQSSDWYRGTADAVYQNMEFVLRHHPDYVLVLSGDHIYQMDYQDLIQFHQRMEADVTVAFVSMPQKGADRFGQGIISEENEKGGRLLRYVEKPSQSISPWASMTIYLFNLEALIYIMDVMMRPPATEHFGRDILPVLLDQKKVYGYQFRGCWAYTRTIDEYYEANMNLLEDNTKFNISDWMVRTNLDNEHIRDRAPAILGSNASVGRSLIHHGCVIHGTVKNSVIFPGVTVDRGAVVENSILMFDSQVRSGANVNRVITDVEVHVGCDSKVGCKENKGVNKEYPDLLNSGISVIGRNTHLPARIKIGCNCIIYPNKTESDFKGLQIAHGRTVK
ncbi:glucose-1-phosphate adenylyltransferase [candidate division KSB1 bacterium]|nr:glucose-1-phosphate adenylyltransferase [candidate division KSB1 bacterium]